MKPRLQQLGIGMVVVLLLVLFNVVFGWWPA